MSDLSLTHNSSPFDSIRHEDADGEYWMGRELMPLLGYPRWSDFEESIERGKAACQNAGNSLLEHFSGLTLKSGGRPRQDYRLSRYGAYLTAMNGDPRKPEVAAAQSYFAAKAREAEVSQGVSIIQPQLPPVRSAVEYIQATKTLSELPRNRLTALAEQLLIAEMAGIQNTQNYLPASEVKHYTTVMLRASQLGYSVKQIDGGVALGKYVKKAIAPDHKDWQGQYQVWQYEVNDELDARIHSFFLTRSL